MMAENFPNVMKDDYKHLWRSTNSKYDELKENQSRHFIAKLSKDKEKESILRAARENQLITYEGL